MAFPSAAALTARRSNRGVTTLAASGADVEFIGAVL